MVFYDTERITIAVITATQLVEVKCERLASVAVLAFHIFRTNTLAFENKVIKLDNLNAGDFNFRHKQNNIFFKSINPIISEHKKLLTIIVANGGRRTIARLAIGETVVSSAAGAAGSPDNVGPTPALTAKRLTFQVSGTFHVAETTQRTTIVLRRYRKDCVTT